MHPDSQAARRQAARLRRMRPRTPGPAAQVPTWLVIFRPSTGDLLRFDRYEDSAEALRERFKAERILSGDPGLEIVTISAASLEVLKKYHSRYFAKGDAAMAEVSRLGWEIENT